MASVKEDQGQPSSGSIPGEVRQDTIVNEMNDRGSPTITMIPLVPKRTDSLENLDEIDRGTKDETPLYLDEAKQSTTLKKVRIQKKNARYYFQHPYSRVFIAYFVVFCNFLIFAEDPVSHSSSKCTVPLIGNDFTFVTWRYPPGGWSVLKFFLWFIAIIIGLLVGKFLFHKLVFQRLMRLQMFYNSQGSWMVMFLTTLVTLFIFSFIYNGFLSLGDPSLSYYRITTYLGYENQTFMKAAGLGTWMGDFVTAWMVTDMMLQDKLYPQWNVWLRRWWRRGWNRVIAFWIVLVVATAIVATGITTDFINWDKLNRDFVTTNELSRAFLASFILIMDLMIVMQDWDFPHFQSNFDIKLPGINTASFHIKMPKFLKRENWDIHISGKWFNYGIIFLVIILDMNMWKNQIFYAPFDYGQYSDPEGYIFSVHNKSFHANRTLMSYQWRSETIDPRTNSTYLASDPRMNSKYLSFGLPVKGIAFIPSLGVFILFGLLIWFHGRESTPGLVVEEMVTDGASVHGVVVETLPVETPADVADGNDGNNKDNDGVPCDEKVLAQEIEKGHDTKDIIGSTRSGEVATDQTSSTPQLLAYSGSSEHMQVAGQHNA